MEQNKVRIGIVAGEVSGDLLGAGLIKELKKLIPNVVFEGICGNNMMREGCISLFPMEKLSIIGIVEAFVKLKYFQITSIRKKLIRHYLNTKPDIFIGIDVPDFNLELERQLKKSGIKTVHYVSPTVWAWRSYRIKKIKKSVNHMLVLFPFEEEFYHKNNIPVTYIGHPLADKLSKLPTKAQARVEIGVDAESRLIALLPGSRKNELRHHSELFINSAKWLYERDNTLAFIVPIEGEVNKRIFNSAIHKINAEYLPITVINGQSHQAMIASDFVILASGTAALESALLERMMVVVYRLSSISYFLIRKLSHINLYSLPNNLAGEEIVPEFIQRDATAEKIGQAVQDYMDNKESYSKTLILFRKMAEKLKRNTNKVSAETIATLLETR